MVVDAAVAAQRTLVLFGHNQRVPNAAARAQADDMAVLI
jgi:hypothetical protein